MVTKSDDVWQAYTEQGEPVLHTPVTREEAKHGALHGAAHVWFWQMTDEGLQLLLQERAPTKRTWPNYYDISAAGHIDFQESPLVAALRETREELGVSLKSEDLHLLFVYRQYNVDKPSQVIENEYQWVYGYEATEALKTNFEDHEVASVKWVSEAQFKQTIDQKSDDKIVPQGEAYFTNLLSAIHREIT